MTEVHFGDCMIFVQEKDPMMLNIECFIQLIHTRKLHGGEMYKSVLKMKTLLGSHGNILSTPCLL